MKAGRGYGVAGEFPSGRAGRQLAELVPGTLIGGYRIEDRIGAGGMAIVFRARDESLGRPVALKVLQSALTDDKEFRERFIRESRAASAVDHPNIIPVHAAGEDSGVLYLAMRYVPGGDLHSLVEREGALPSDRVLSLLTPIASALDAAHGAGIVHRDVKPANVLIDHSPGRPDHPYLSDFGLAKGSVAHTLTNTGEFVGTAGFASPEQLSGRPVTPQTDQYALACVAYTVLTASLPFQHGDPEVALWAQMSSPPPRVTDRRSDLFPSVDDAIARALSRDPADRYASCGEFARELRQALVAPSGGGRLPTKLPTKLPGRFSHQAGPAEPAEPSQPQRQPGLPSDIARPPTMASRAADRPVSRTAPAPGMVPLHDGPGQHRRLPRNPRGTSSRKRRLALGAGAAILAIAVVAGGVALLSGGSQPKTGSAPSPSASGSVRLAATLPSADGKAPVSMVFAPGNTLRSADRSGSVSTFDLTSQRSTNSFSLSGAPSALDAVRFSLDGSKLVGPSSTCAASGCTYTVSGGDGSGPSTTVTGGPGPLFSTGNDTMAYTGGRDTGVSVWNLKSGTPVAKGLADPDHGTVKALAVDPSGEAVAVSSGTAGPAHHVYWWTVSSRSVVATESVPASMGAPWAGPGVNGLPMGLTGQTLALSSGQSTDIFRAPPDQAAQARRHSVPGGLMAISPDNGNLVATTDQTSGDGIDLWNVQTGQQTASLNLPAAPAAVTFSPDGKSVAVGCSNGDVYVWTITAP